MKLSRRHILRALALSPALASPTLLSACAGGGSSSSEGTLNVGQISNSVAFFPLFIAEERGYFDDEGLTLGERPRLGTGAKVAAALKAGSIDLGAGVMTDAFNLRGIDEGGRLTTSLVSEYYVDIIAGGSLDDDGASLEDRVRALRGKAIGITGPGSGTEALVSYLFDLVGLDSATDATLVNLGAESSAAIGALQSGRVDALSFFQPIGQQAEAAGVGSLYISPARGDVPDLEGALHGVVFGLQDVLDQKAEEVAAFNSAIERSLELIAGDEQEARSLLGDYLEGTDPAVLDDLVGIVTQEVSGQVGIVQAEYDVERAFHVDSGLFVEAPSFDDMVPTDFRA